MELLRFVIGQFKYSKNIYGLFLIHIVCMCLILPIISHQSYGAKNDGYANELPFCKPNVDTPQQFRPMIVLSTLDGHVTALDTIKGSVLWSVDIESGPLLQSTISNHEFINQGKWSRLIPSLNGDLFTYDGESMSAIPISADSLLSNSMKISDDTVIIGGKLIQLYGIKKDTGELVFNCGIEKCKQLDDVIQNSDDEILLVRRLTRTVRALSTSGTEKWNYSVGQLEVSLAQSAAHDGCHKYDQKNKNDHSDYAFENMLNNLSNLSIRFSSSDGLVFMFNGHVSTGLIWQHKFSSPIVNAWNVTNKKVQIFDLFDCRYNSKLASRTDTVEPVNPLLYIGIYKQQLYVVESEKLTDSLPVEARTFGFDLTSNSPKVTWHPYLITSHSRTPTIIGNLPDDINGVVNHVKGDDENTALAIGHNGVEYPFDNGFYLYAQTPENQNLTSEDEAIDIIIISLWYWWKEILAISVTLAILLNILYTKLIRIPKHCIQEPKHEVVIHLLNNESNSQTKKSNLNSQNSNSSSSQLGTPPAEFISRYLTDFEPLEKLGKGGFGVVFRARNKIDDCEYAIKRISMPSNQDSKDRILREVKILAKLDHTGIVRYYNSWLECPPADWQAMADESGCAGNMITPTYSLTTDELDAMYENRTEETQSNPKRTFVPEKFSNILNNNGDSKSLNLRNRFAPKFTPNLNFEEKFCDDSGLIIKKNSQETSSDSFIVFDCGNSKSNVENESREVLRNAIDEKYLDQSTEKSISESPSLSLNKMESSSVITRSGKDINAISLPIWAKPTKTFLYIQMQLCKKDTLKDWLNENKSREIAEVLDIFYQIVSAVGYVHDQGLMHRDLKPSNIFFAKDGTIKVGDFGLVTNMFPSLTKDDVENPTLTSPNVRHTNQVGTTLYMSPEQIAGEKYDHKVDIFSLGLVLFELLVPFNTAMERIKTMNEARAMKFSPKFINDSPKEHCLVKQMLAHIPSQRPTTEEILKDPLLHEFQLPPERFVRTRTMSRTYSLSSNGSSQGIGTGDVGSINDVA